MELPHVLLGVLGALRSRSCSAADLPFLHAGKAVTPQPPPHETASSPPTKRAATGSPAIGSCRTALQSHTAAHPSSTLLRYADRVPPACPANAENRCETPRRPV